ncbi:MAG: hypothetical protein ACI4V7_10665 [Succinivibrionaceae bacterium]
MRCAVCISGAFRGNYKLALDSIYANLVNPLNADVFIETWDNYYEWPGACCSNFVERLFGNDIFKITPKCLSTENLFKKNLPNTYKRLINPITQKLNISDITSCYDVVQISINSEDVFSKNILNDMDITGKFLPNQYRMFYLMYKVNELMHSYEKASNIKYDVVIRIRPDVVFEKPPIITGYSDIKDNEVLMKWIYWGLDDVFLVSKPSTMDKLLSLWLNVLKIKKLSPFKNHKYRSHPLLTAWTSFKNIGIVSYNYSLTINKVLEDYLPNINKEINEDLQLLKQSNHPEFVLIKIWIDEIEKKLI